MITRLRHTGGNLFAIFLNNKLFENRSPALYMAGKKNLDTNADNILELVLIAKTRLSVCAWSQRKKVSEMPTRYHINSIAVG